MKILDVRVRRGAICGSDHHLLNAKIVLQTKTTQIYAVEQKQGEYEETKQIKYNLELNTILKV